VPIDNHVWLLLLFNVTIVLALSWLGFTFIKRGAHCFKASESKNIGISRLISNGLTILANKYLIVRRMIKIDTDDDPPHYLLSLKS